VAAAASPVAAAPAGSTTFTIVPANSEARFVARELLAGAAIKNDAIGKTKEVSGQVVIANNAPAAGSSITVKLASLASDRSQRDQFIKMNVLRTNQNPDAVFVPKSFEGLSTVPASGEATFKILGDLTINGQTRPATWDVTATFSANQIVGKGNTVVQLPQFGMQKPSVPVVAEIEDNIRLELDFTATRG
jgi:polyisoprenoid-binding protein YceI